MKVKLLSEEDPSFVSPMQFRGERSLTSAQELDTCLSNGATKTLKMREPMHRWCGQDWPGCQDTTGVAET